VTAAMPASFVRSVNSLMTGAPFSDRGVQHIPFPSQSPDCEPGVRWLTRAVHRRALEARDVQEHRNTGLHSLSSSHALTHTFVVALCASGAAIARPRDCSVGLVATVRSRPRRLPQPRTSRRLRACGARAGGFRSGPGNFQSSTELVTTPRFEEVS